MSAIAGIYHPNAEPIDVKQCRGLMNDLLKYPFDDSQTWESEHVFLGCHAQWNTPESVGEQNPYFDSERRLAITADAIIDNRAELFDQLQVERGLRQGMTDSELILLAYYKWGEDVPKYLIGDFAFLIWDERNEKFFGARDFSGSRTLYFHKNQHRVAFCTLIEPLLTLTDTSRELNDLWIAEFLANPGATEVVDETSTVFKEIVQVPPSHSITVSRSKFVISRYCKIIQDERLKLKSNGEYEEAFLDVMQEAISARLRTRHQVGAYLSGGLDSGTVASLSARLLQKENKSLHTYSYIPVEDFKGWKSKSRISDERPFIYSTVKHIGNINDHYLDFKGKSALTEVDDWLDIIEMPYKIFENSYWIRGIYETAKQQEVSMLLTGARGNLSISWGYPISYYAMLMRKMRLIHLSREIQMYSVNQGIGRSQLLKTITQKAYPFMKRNRSQQNHYRFPMLINPDFARKTGIIEKLNTLGIDPAGFASNVNMFKARRKHYEQSNVWNLNGISNTKMSLRYSIWNRDPSNDLRVIKFCLSVPEEQYVRDGMDRALIRNSTENLLPDDVRLNQRVRGIQGADGLHRMIPMWDSFVDELQQLSSDPEFSQYINTPVIKKSIDKMQGTDRPQDPFDTDFCILMRSLILYRFMRKNA